MDIPYLLFDDKIDTLQFAGDAIFPNPRYVEDVEESDQSVSKQVTADSLTKKNSSSMWSTHLTNYPSPTQLDSFGARINKWDSYTNLPNPKTSSVGQLTALDQGLVFPVLLGLPTTSN